MKPLGAIFFVITSFLPFSQLLAQEPLRVGMELAYPPFEMTTTTGEPAGISVEISKALGDYLDRKVQIQNIAFDGLIPALKSGKIDLIVSSMTATPERASTIDFSEPYLITGLCLLVRKDSHIASIQDADRDGRKIAVKKGTTGHLYAAKNLNDAKMLVLDKETAAVLEVVQGKADAFIYDQMSVFKHWQSNKKTTSALLEPFQKESWAIGLRKGDDDLREQVNQFLEKFRAEGGFKRLGDEFLGEQKKAFAENGVQFYF